LMAVVVTVIFPGQEAFYADARASALAATRWIQAESLGEGADHAR